MDKFLIIDGNSIMNRAFYGVNARMSSKTAGIHTNAIYGFLNIYWMIIDKISPDYIAVSFDLKAPTFRHKMYEAYKGTRKGMPDELREQMPVIKEVLNAMNIPILEIEGFEADDILGTVARCNEEKNIFTYILTGDRDSFQLISSLTSIIIPLAKAGKTEYNIYTPEMLDETYHITPAQVVDIKSLMGDSSDNIPGVKGIGEKTAHQLIEKYSSLDNVYKSIDENSIDTTPKIKEKLVDDREMAYLSYKLATIDRKVPINIDYEMCKVSDINKEKLFRLFKNLEFSKFLSKFDFSMYSDQDENKSNNNNKKLDIAIFPKLIVIDNANLNNFLDQINTVLSEDKLSYILNTDNLEVNSNKVFAIYSSKQDTVYIFNEAVFNSNCFNDILLKFITSKSEKLGFNLKKDIKYYFNRFSTNVNLCGFSYDLMIAYYLLDSTRGKYIVTDILEELFDVKFQLESNLKQKQISLFDEMNNENESTLSEDTLKNICLYLKCIYLSHDIIIDRLKTENMYDLFLNIEMPLTETLASMEHVGMYINREKLDEFDVEITSSLSITEKEIYEIAGESFNINSPKQLGVILFEKLGLEHKRKTKTGYSTDKSVLEDLQGKHPIVDKILYYRQLAKLKSTYVDGLKDKIESDNRIHTTFMQTVTTTGRLSSVEPNLQNIPIKLELGRKIRKFFGGEGDNLIVDADYSQIELRVMSHISGDQTMIDAFNNNIDIHKVTASQVFGVALNEVEPLMRSKAKAVNFGIIYGISAFGLSKNIGTSRYEAQQYIDNYLSKYSGIRKFMEDIVKKAKLDGYVSTMFNRRRYIPEINDRNKNIALFGERIAINTPIQGTAADIIKIAMNRVYANLKKAHLKSKLIMQVHDELIIEACPDEIDAVKNILTDAMKNVAKLKVPLDIDLNVGKSWYDAK